MTSDKRNRSNEPYKNNGLNRIYNNEEILMKNNKNKKLNEFDKNT